MAVDPLWEKYRSLTPYNYSNNNPLVLKDPSGKGGVTVQHTPEDAFRLEGGASGGAAPSGAVVRLVDVLGRVIGVIADVILIDNAMSSSKEDGAKSESKSESTSKSQKAPAANSSDAEQTDQEGGNQTEERNWRQDKQLSQGEIKKLKDHGYDVHELKEQGAGGGPPARYDLYKDRQGNLYVKPKGGQGPGEAIDVNINNLN